MTTDSMTPAAHSGKPIPSAPLAERYEITDYAGVPDAEISKARGTLGGTFAECMEWIGPVVAITLPKHSADAWAPHVTPDGIRKHRTHVTLFVADCDKMHARDIAAFAARLDSSGIAYQLHTTYGHTPEQPKARIAIALSRAVAADEWRDGAWPALMRAVGLDPAAAARADNQCKDASRLYFRPTCPPERLSLAFSQPGKGDRAIDVDAVLANDRVASASALSTIETALQGLNEVKVGKLRTLEDCLSALKAAPEKHGAARDCGLRMGSILCERGVSQAEAEEVVWLASKSALEDNARLGSSEPVKDWANVENLARSGVRLAYEQSAANNAPPAPEGFFGSVLKGSDFASYQARVGSPRWVCEALQVAEGRPVFIAGRPGDGKTFIVLELLLAAANGGKALGQFPCAQGRVGILDFESGPRNLVRRLDRLRVGGEHASLNAIEVYSMPERNLASDGAEAALKVLCAGLMLLVIDSLSAALPGQNENDSRIGEYLTMLTRVSLATGCAIAVLHHYRKPAAQDGKDADPRDMLRGSSAILSQAGAVWALSGKPEKDAPKTMTLIRQSQDATEHPEPFTVRITDTSGGGLRVLAEVKGTANAEKRAADAASVQRALILGAVGSNESGLTRRALREHVPGRDATLGEQLDAMAADGLLVVDTNKNYPVYLTPANAALRAENKARTEAAAEDRKQAQQREANKAYLARVLAFVGASAEGASLAQVQVHCPPPKGIKPKDALATLHAEGRLRLGPSLKQDQDVYTVSAAPSIN